MNWYATHSRPDEQLNLIYEIKEDKPTYQIFNLIEGEIV
jgi:hypothetical protein